MVNVRRSELEIIDEILTLSKDGAKNNVILGIINHEYETIEYNVEVWLINQTIDDENTITIHNMWFIDNISVTLNHKDLDINKEITSQWEHNYTFSINKIGSYKLSFLLFKAPTGKYVVDNDYIEIAEEKIQNAYRQTHLWIEIN